MGQIEGAQGELESNIEVLRRAAAAGGDAGALGQAEAQMQALTRLQHKIGRADPSTLAAIRAEVVASVAASVALTQTARTSAANAQTAEVALHAASAAAQREVSALAYDVFEKKIFDPYLRFASAEDEAAYRKRKAETKRYIEEQLARGTPEGNLNAAGAMVGQLNDAEAHGAGASPEFQGRKARALTAFNDLRDATRASGHSTAEAEALAGANADRVIAVANSKPALSLDKNAASEVDDLAASLRAAGLTATPDTQKGHGVARREPASGAIVGRA